MNSLILWIALVAVLLFVATAGFFAVLKLIPSLLERPPRKSDRAEEDDDAYRANETPEHNRRASAQGYRDSHDHGNGKR